MNKLQTRGTGLVYRFTLGQIVKSKSNLITCGILLLAAAAAVPVMSIFLGGGSDEPAVYTGYTNIYSVAEFLDGGQLGFDARYGIQYVYSILVMIVCVFAVSYIVRAVVEEKASKLVESLVVSIRPVALLLGKILAVMTYILGLLAAFAAAFGISWLISGQFLDVSFVSEFLANKGISMELLNLGAGTIFAVVVSLVLAYLLFAFIAGLAGAGCSNMEEVGGASTAATWAILLGYFAALFGGMADSTIVNYLLALVPVASSFGAPVLYVFGDIGFGVLIVSWLIQIIAIAALLVLSGRVYDRLILYKGERLTMRKILAVAADRDKGFDKSDDADRHHRRRGNRKHGKGGAE